MIFNYFLLLENSGAYPSKLKKLYRDLFNFDDQFKEITDTYSEFYSGLNFMYVQTPNEKIQSNLKNLEKIETRLKLHLRELLNNIEIQNEIDPETHSEFEKYLSKELTYFDGAKYNDENLNILFTALNKYGWLLQRSYFIIKRRLLNYQSELLNSKQLN